MLPVRKAEREVIKLHNSDPQSGFSNQSTLTASTMENILRLLSRRSSSMPDNDPIGEETSHRHSDRFVSPRRFHVQETDETKVQQPFLFSPA